MNKQQALRVVNTSTLWLDYASSLHGTSGFLASAGSEVRDRRYNACHARNGSSVLSLGTRIWGHFAPRSTQPVSLPGRGSNLQPPDCKSGTLPHTTSAPRVFVRC